MSAITDKTRSRLVALIRRQPMDLMPGQIPTDLLDETRETLRSAFAKLGYSERLQLSKTPGTSGSVNFWDEARWLLTEGKREDAEKVIQRLEQFVTNNSVVIQRVEAVWGLHPDRPIQLSENLTLVPLANLRPSAAREALLETDGSKHPHVRQAKPRAAIVQEIVHQPLYFRPHEEMAPFTWEDKHFMSDLSLVLALLNDSPVVPVAGWYQTDLEVPVLGSGGGWGGSFHEPRIVRDIAPQSYDEALAFRLVSGFLKFSPPDKRRMNVALRRLNLAFLREMPSDIALELGIALEALLSETGDPSDSISYRLKTRAAVLLGGTIEAREEISAQISRLYSLRSTAAHGGDLDGHWRGLTHIPSAGKKYTAEKLQETLEHGRRLCGHLARELLYRGKFPNYHRMILGEIRS
jgi:hypothetical protein